MCYRELNSYSYLESSMIVLGIETSCDETAAAVVEDGCRVLSNVVSSQVELHRIYRGVVPEIASRAHTRSILPVMDEALRRSGRRITDIDAVAVTASPGLIGSLLVGLAAARTVALVRQIPVLEVNHLEAHVFSSALARPLEYPLVGLVVSGGHTDIYRSGSETDYVRLGHTIDDAVGEAFDKVAAILDLPYPGGPSIEEAARDGDPEAIRFPRSYLEPGSFDFSFSGVKTAVLYHCRGPTGRGDLSPAVSVPDVAACFQRAVIDVLVDKTIAAARKENVRTVAVGGGVACNASLREMFLERARPGGIDVTFPDLEYCTDNAAMVAGLGYHKLHTAG